MAGAYGEDCATQLGLITRKPRLQAHEQTGPDLFHPLEDDDGPEDHCDG